MALPDYIPSIEEVSIDNLTHGGVGDGGDGNGVGDGNNGSNLKIGVDTKVYSMRNILYSVNGYHTQ